jgi:hypothetical protein
MLRRRPSREARDREVGRAPEEMDRAALADEAPAEVLHDPVGLREDAPVAIDRVGRVRRVDSVLIETDRVCHLVGLPIDVHVQVQLAHFFAKAAVERRDGLWLQRKAPPAAVARLDDELVRDEVEVDLEGSDPVGNR